MAESSHTKSADREYLLGRLPKDDAAFFENEFFADDDKFQELEIAEDQLIDDYVRNKLSAGDRQQFRTLLMTSPRIAERVKFASALAQRASSSVSQSQEAGSEAEPLIGHSTPSPRTPWWKAFFRLQPVFQVALAASVAFVCIGGGALVISELRIRGESSRLAAERAALQQQKEELEKQATDERTRVESLNASLQRQRDQLEQQIKVVEEQQRNLREGPGPSVPGSIAAFLLIPGGVRSPGSSSDLTFGPEVANAQFKLALVSGDYRSYGVSIKRPDGDEVFSQKGLKPRKTRSGMVLVISVPTRRLPPDDYNVDVEGETSSGNVEPVSDYHFRVLPKPKS